MAQAPCLTAPSQKYLGSAESLNRSRRLSLLREQLVRENRRSAAPFSHPLAIRGPLQTLCNQIRDVSRIADAVALNADSASDGRVQELCADLRRLLQTQQRWTERLENQIWRLESQGKLMRRLQQVLQMGSPGTDQLWELCELIARETQALPDGLLLLPEPGHRIAVAQEGTNVFTANTIEKARLCIFAGMSILPDVRGADLAAATFQACLHHQPGWFPATSETSADTNPGAAFERFRTLEIPGRSRPLSSDGLRLVDLASEFSDQLELHSLKANDKLVPPPIREYYSELAASWPSTILHDESSREMARSMCSALGLSEPVNSVAQRFDEDGDDKLVLFHKLRWHDGETSNETERDSSVPSQGFSPRPAKTIRRPRFLPSMGGQGAGVPFRVFSEQ